MAGSNRDYDEREDLQVFETGDDQDSEGSSLLMAIVISLLVLAALGCVVWIAYNNGVAHGHRDVAMQAMSAAKDTPLATGDTSPPKSQAKAEEGDGASAPAATAPAPVAPVQATAAPAPITQTQQVANAPAAKAVPQATKPPAQLMPPRPLSQVAAAPAPATSASKAPARLQPPQLPAQKSATVKSVTAKPVDAKAEAKPVAAPKVTEKAAAKPAEKPAEKTAVAEKSVAKPAAKSGSYMLQLGAYKTEAEADAAWKSYKAKHAAALGGASPDIQKADLGEKGTWYRLRTGPFASKDAAGAQCDKLKADGGSCFPAK